jgi:hypothetical protein
VVVLLIVVVVLYCASKQTNKKYNILNVLLKKRCGSRAAANASKQK